eukprot:INCI5956.6.p1 GENE.INCI5956.6~~INCI5956.6.p1  ORF type:complete len:1149 (-),score=218.86 INCI5956.6:1000-4446(-)
MTEVQLRTWITYRLVDDVTQPGSTLEAFLANPLFALSTHPEHEEFYTSNPLACCNRSTLAKISGLVRNEVGGHGHVRILEVGAGACGFASRIKPLLREAIGTYICSDSRGVHMPQDLVADSRFSTMHHDLDCPLPDFVKPLPTKSSVSTGNQQEKLRTQDVIVASHALFLARDVRASLRHLARKLRVGGLMIIEEFTGDHGVLMWGADKTFVWDRAVDGPGKSRRDVLWMSPEEWRQAVLDVTELDLIFAQERPGNLTMVLRRASSSFVKLGMQQHVKVGPKFEAKSNLHGAGTAIGDASSPIRTPVRRSSPEKGNNQVSTSADISASGDGMFAADIIDAWDQVDLSKPQVLVGDGSHAFRRCLEQEDDVTNLQTLCYSDSKTGSVHDTVFAQCEIAELLTSEVGQLRYLTLLDGRVGTTVSVPLDCTLPLSESSLSDDATHRMPKNFSLAIAKAGDLNSVHWSVKTANESDAHNGSQVKVEFAALNALDVDVVFGRRRVAEYELGVEFSGTTAPGTAQSNSVFGISRGCISGVLAKPPLLQWAVPTGMGVAKAATLPVAYLTAAYSLLVQSDLKAGDSILIHDAVRTSVGRAALHLAKQRGLNILATFSSQWEHQDLLQQYRMDATAVFDVATGEAFLASVMQKTSGRGVDCVLWGCDNHSTASLQASLECVANFGHFCDLNSSASSASSANTSTITKHWARGVSYHTFDLYQAATHSSKIRSELQQLMQTLLDNGEVAPLPLAINAPEDVAEVIKRLNTKEPETVSRKQLLFMKEFLPPQKAPVPPSDEKDSLQRPEAKIAAVPRYVARGVHIVTGGLGGFGLELVHWLLSCGASQVIITSRSGIRTGWQKFRFEALLSKYGPDAAVISNLDVTNADQAQKLVCGTSSNAGRVRGLWHSAVVLRDGLFQKANSSDWDISTNSKIGALRNLHSAAELLRSSSAEQLDDFVVFSSVTSMGGNCGQTVYGWGNNACERLMEHRRRLGLPGVAIQWGAIESAGLATNLDGEVIHMGRGVEVAKQNIDDSLESLHKILTSASTSSTVSSYRLRVEKPTRELSTPDGDSGNPSDAVDSVQKVLEKLADILGGSATDYDPSFPLQEYGLDSLSVVEVMNWINRLVSVKVTPSFVSRDTTCNSIFKYIDDNRLS